MDTYVIVSRDDVTQFWDAKSKSFKPMVAGVYSEYKTARMASRTLNVVTREHGHRVDRIYRPLAIKHAWR